MTGPQTDPGQQISETSKLLTAILDQIIAGNQYAAVQRERTIYPVNLSPGLTWRSDGRSRLHSLLVSGAPGDRLGLNVGTAILFDWLNITGDPFVIEVPILVTPGSDVRIVDISDAADTTWRAWLWVWREAGMIP